VAPGKFTLAAYLPKGESIRDFAAIAASMESTEGTHIQVTGSSLKQDLKLVDSSGFRSKLRSCSGDK
jgi:hypothetical protein